MNISRRDALKLAAAGAALSAISPAGAAAARALFPADGLARWPILQGPTDDRSACFVILHPHGLPFEVRFGDPFGGALPWRIAGRFDMAEIGLAATEIAVTGLVPGLEYRLELAGGTGEAFDRRSFGALDVARPRCRFAVASCMNDRYRRHAVTMWEAMAREDCDFIVLLGDTCYADLGNPGHRETGYLRRYSETRLALSWFRLERLVPTFAVWDDHDYGVNNGDRHFATAPFMRRLFRAFWGSTENRAWRMAFGAGSRLEAFGQRFHLLDDRSWRDPPGTPGGSHWGAEQREWLLADLARDGRPAWLMNGTQFFAEWLLPEVAAADQPDDVRALTTGLAATRAPVVFVSGDTHYSEIERIDPSLIGYETREYTSSSIHSAPFYGPLNAYAPHRLAATRRHNFLVFDVDTAGGWRIDCRAVLEDNITAFAESARIGR
jgi:hypothetical protein